MGNILFTRIVEPVNPKQPNQFFGVLIPFLRFNGLWVPDNNEKWIQNLFFVYSILFRFIFIYLFTFFQAMFFIELTNLMDYHMVLFLLLSQFSMIFKVEKFYANRHRIKECIRALNNFENIPQDKNEDEIIRKTSIYTMNLFTFYIFPMFFAFTSAALMVFQPGFQLPVPAWYPFDIKKYPIYYFVFAHNYSGALFGALSNVHIDFIITALFMSAKAQIQRLGAAIEDINYEKMESRVQPSMLKFYVLRHKQLLDFTAEIQDIFSSSIFCQFALTTLIICLTLLAISDGGPLIEMVPMLAYLNSMIIQIFLYCLSGNEITLALDALPQKIFSSSFLNFDAKNSKILLVFMQRTLLPNNVTAGSVFKVTLSLKIFMDILKSSYSYFTILRKIQY